MITEIKGIDLRKEIFDKVVPTYRKHKHQEIELNELEDFELYQFCNFDLEAGLEFVYNKGFQAGKEQEMASIQAHTSDIPTLPK